MSTSIARLRAAARAARMGGGLVLVKPAELDALLNVVEHPDEVGLDESVISR